MKSKADKKSSGKKMSDGVNAEKIQLEKDQITKI